MKIQRLSPRDRMHEEMCQNPIQLLALFAHFEIKFKQTG